MSSISLTTHREQLATVKDKAKQPLTAAVRRVGIYGAGIALGHLERTGTLKPSVTIFGQPVPLKGLVALAGHFAQAKLKGDASMAAGVIADTAAAVQGYASGRAGEFVAGR